MKVIDNKDLKKPFIAKLVLILVFVYSFFVGLEIAYHYNYFENYDFFGILVVILTIAISIILSFLLSVLIHETGHLVFGLLSGYKFHSFQVFNIKIMKNENDKTVFKFSKNMLLGQCILKNENENKDTKYKLYLYGGALFNLIFTIIPTILYILFAELKGLSYLSLIIVAWINLFMFYSNGVPLNVQNIYNDALNLKLMNKYNFFKDLVLNSLKLQNALETKKSINDIDINLISSADDIDYTIIHKYGFIVAESIRRIINNIDNPFELILEMHRFRWSLPIQYKYSNITFVLYYYLLNEKPYKGIISDKTYKPLIKSAKNYDPLLEICLKIIDLKEDKISKNEVIDFINIKIKELPKKVETRIEEECYLVLMNKAITYIEERNTFIEE